LAGTHILKIQSKDVCIPRFHDVVFYPFSSIENRPIICESDFCRYICVFVDYFPMEYAYSTEICQMRDLLEFAQSNKVDKFILIHSNLPNIAMSLDEYIEATRPE